MNKFNHIISAILITTILLPIGTPTLAKSPKANQQKLQKLETRKTKWLKLSQNAENLSEKKKDRIIKKLEKLRKEEVKLETKQRMKDFQAEKKTLREKIKNKNLSKSEKENIKKALKEHHKSLKKINEEIKAEFQNKIKKELTTEENLAVAAAQPIVLMELQDTLTTNDPLLDQQWGLKSINLTSQTSTENKKVVAVIDTGINFNHEDLQGTAWTNNTCVDANNEPIEGGCMNGGWDFIGNDNNPFPSDNHAHGTAVAGIISAQTNNNTGISGVATSNNVQIMSLRACCTEEGFFPTSTASEAIYFAVNNGADIINASFGGPSTTTELEEALRYAESNNVLVVTSAGNYASNNDTTPLFPANYNQTLNNIISVGAIDNNDQLATFSNYGSQTVDIAAPGQNILSLLANNTYGNVHGTSFSTPFVTGVLADFFLENKVLSARNELLTKMQSLGSLQGLTKNNKVLRFPNTESENDPSTGSGTIIEEPVIIDPVEEPEPEIEEPETPIIEPEDPINETITDTKIIPNEEAILTPEGIGKKGKRKVWKMKKKIGYQNETIHYADIRKADVVAEFKLLNSNETDSLQKVSISWNASKGNTDNVQYEIHHVNGIETFTINQTLLSDQTTTPAEKYQKLKKANRELPRRERKKLKINAHNMWSDWYDLGELKLDENSKLMVSIPKITPEEIENNKKSKGKFQDKIKKIIKDITSVRLKNSLK